MTQMRAVFRLRHRSSHFCPGPNVLQQLNVFESNGIYRFKYCPAWVFML